MTGRKAPCALPAWCCHPPASSVSKSQSRLKGQLLSLYFRLERTLTVWGPTWILSFAFLNRSQHFIGPSIFCQADLSKRCTCLCNLWRSRCYSTTAKICWGHRDCGVQLSCKLSASWPSPSLGRSVYLLMSPCKGCQSAHEWDCSQRDLDFNHCRWSKVNRTRYSVLNVDL